MPDDDRPQESVGPHWRHRPDAFADLDRSAVAALDGLSYREVGRFREQDLLRIAQLGHATLDQATRNLRALMSPQHDLLTGITKLVMDDIEARRREMLAATRVPEVDLLSSAAGSAVGALGEWREDLLAATRVPEVDLLSSVAGSAVGALGEWREEMLAAARVSEVDLLASTAGSAVGALGEWREDLLDAVHRPLLESQRSLVDSLPPSFLERPIDLLDTARRPWLETPLVVDLPVPNPGIHIQDRQQLRPTRECATDPVDVIELATSESLVAQLVCVQGVFEDSFIKACLEDIRYSLEDGRPIAAVDRAHATVHRMLQLLAEEHGWEFNRHEGVPDLFRYLRQNHPAFMIAENGGSGVELFGKLSSLLQTLTEARNQHSLAHPTEHQLSSPWARFVVSSALAIFELLADLHAERRIKVPVSASRRQN